MSFSRALRSWAGARLRGPQPSGEGRFAVKRPMKLPENRGGEPLASGVRLRMERRFGQDFSRVRVHQGTEAASLSSVAFAMGEHLYFEPGRFRPDTPSGERLLGHELTHVVQQRKMGLSTRTPSQVAVLDDRGLERQADASGGRINRGENAQVGPVRSAAVGSVPAGTGVAQCSAQWMVKKPKGFLAAEAIDNDPLGRAKEVRAPLIWLANGQYLKNYYLEGSAPTDAGNPPGWVEYVKGKNFAPANPASKGLPNNRTNWKRLHLLNDNLGGPGDKKYNLTPGRTITNSAMLHGIEGDAKYEVEGGGAIRYRVQVTYGHSGGPKYVPGAPGHPADLMPAGHHAGVDVFELFPSEIKGKWQDMKEYSGAAAPANWFKNQVNGKIYTPGALGGQWASGTIPKPLDLQNTVTIDINNNSAISEAKQEYLQYQLGINANTVKDMSEVMEDGGVVDLDDLRMRIGILNTENIENAERFIKIV